MNVPKLAISRPVTTGMAIMVIILVGCLSIIGIPMDLMPSFDLPVAIAYVQYPNAAPEEIEQNGEEVQDDTEAVELSSAQP